MTQDTEALERQVRKLTRERDKLRKELDDAYTAIAHAGAKARGMRGDIDRLSKDVLAMAAVLGDALRSDGTPDDVKTAASAALSGVHLDGDGVDPNLVADIVRRFEAARGGRQ